MKKALVLVALFCVVGCGSRNANPAPADQDDVGDGDGGAGDSDTDHLPKALVHYIGRHDTRDAARVRADWSATSVFATFDGTGVTARIDGAANDFEVFIDGERTATLRFTPGSGSDKAKTLSLASGLTNARHTVQLMRRTEAFNNPTEFLGFSVTGGALVETAYPFPRRIEVVGDSITCGYGIEGDNATCPFTPATENAANTYAAQTARNFNAALSVVAFSGKGMYRDLDFNMDLTMPKIYDRALFNDAELGWVYATYVPDVLVINLGTNDFGNGDPGEAFTETYVEFIQRVELLYPGVEVFCVAGGMSNGGMLTRVQAAVNARHTAGDMRVHYVQFPPLTNDEFGCDYHPNVAANTEMAGILSDAISEAVGW